MWPVIYQWGFWQPFHRPELPEDAEVGFVWRKRTSSFQAKISTSAIQQDVATVAWLRQTTRQVKVIDGVSAHEAFWRVLLWLWQKFCLLKRDDFLPDFVAWMLGERKGSSLEPCKACANGTCSAMEEAARAAQM